MPHIKIEGFTATGDVLYVAKPHPFFCLSGTVEVSLNVNYMSSAGGLVVNTTKKARKEENTNN